MNLLIKPKKDSREIVSVTSESSGLHYVSFSACKLAPGETLSFSDSSRELCVVVLSGIVSAQTEGFDWKEIGERMSVFEDASPYAVYLPPRAKLTVTAKTDAELGVAGAPAKGALPARLIEPASIRRTVRGKGSNTRYVCDILPQRLARPGRVHGRRGSQCRPGASRLPSRCRPARIRILLLQRHGGS
jgi:5-deoxy-glucuronate isomerase